MTYKSILTIIGLLFCFTTAVAAPISSNSSGGDWVKASSSERYQYSSNVVRHMHAPYSVSALTNCINEIFSDSELRRLTVTDVATMCHVELR